MKFAKTYLKCSLCKSDSKLKSLGNRKFICENCDSLENRAKFDNYNFRTTNIHTSKSYKESTIKTKRKAPGYLARNVI